ncbi:MAG: proprotein convertase P-domain-containing protein [Sedimentisphaerales bacterium]
MFASGVFVVISQMSAFGANYFSFGKGVNQSWGQDYEKNWVWTSIFVPVSGTIQNIDLALNLQHTSFDDLQIYIDSPSGTTACINSYDRYNFKKDRNINGWIVFDEESPFGIDQAQSLNMGLFKSNGPDSLSMFYGEQSYGTWQVRIQDTIYYNTGTLKDVRFDMLIDSKSSTTLVVPEPSSILLAIAGAAFLLRIKRNT